MIPLIKQQPANVLRLAGLALILSFSTLQGQGFWAWNLRTHPELDWQVITTDHFNIYYHQGLEDVARRGAAIAEQVYQPIMDQLQMADFGRTDMVFTAEDEIINGFAMPSNQIFIWAYQNDATGWFIGSEKWLRTVIAHEFQHIAFMNGVKTWLGVWDLLLTPGWFIEGTAEYYTEKWRVGRSDSRMKVHTYMNKMNRLDPHDAGYAKVLYLADKYGDSTIAKLVHYRDELKIGKRKLLTLPYFFKRAFKKVTGQTVAQFNEEWRRAMNTYYYSYRGQKEGVGEVGEPLVIPGMAAIRSLAVSPDSSRIAVVGRADKDMRDWSLYTISTDSAHKRVELRYGQFSGNPAWSPDGRTIAISEYHRGRHGSLIHDIRLIDVERRKARLAAGQARWLTRDARALDPVWSPDGRYILYVAHPGMATNLYLTDPAGEKVTRLTAFEGDVQVQDPQWSPDGSQIVFAIQEEDGMVDIAVMGADGADYRKLTNDPEEDLAPLWSADGRWIIFTSFRNSTPNLYRVPATGGEIIPMTDVVEGIYTTQIMPGSGEVVTMTLADVDTVRVRRLPVDRSVAHSGPPVMREKFARWRQGQPEIPVPTVDLAQVPPVDGPRPYRSWGTWRPAMRLALPGFYSVGGFGVWQDALGKNQLLLAGEARYEDWDWSGIASWTNARFAPFLTLTAYRNFKLRVRGYLGGYLFETLSGAEVNLRLPIDTRNSRLNSRQDVSLRLRGLSREPDLYWAALPEIVGYTPPIDTVREGGVALRYQYVSRRPHRDNAFMPRYGHGLRVTLEQYDERLFGDWNYGQGEVSLFACRRLGPTPIAAFGRLVGTAQWGDPPRQDQVGLRDDPSVYLNPGTLLGMLGDFVETPELHSLRGLGHSYPGSPVVSGTVELRLPLVEKPLVTFLGLGLGQFTAAAFVDFGQVVGGSPFIWTQGIEIKANLLVGNLALLTLAYGYAGTAEAWRLNWPGPPRSYMRMGLVSPF